MKIRHYGLTGSVNRYTEIEVLGLKFTRVFIRGSGMRLDANFYAVSSVDDGLGDAWEAGTCIREIVRYARAMRFAGLA